MESHSHRIRVFSTNRRFLAFFIFTVSLAVVMTFSWNIRAAFAQEPAAGVSCDQYSCATDEAAQEGPEAYPEVVVPGQEGPSESTSSGEVPDEAPVAVGQDQDTGPDESLLDQDESFAADPRDSGEVGDEEGSEVASDDTVGADQYVQEPTLPEDTSDPQPEEPGTVEDEASGGVSETGELIDVSRSWDSCTLSPGSGLCYTVQRTYECTEAYCGLPAPPYDIVNEEWICTLAVVNIYDSRGGKLLRQYEEVSCLPPAGIDPQTGLPYTCRVFYNFDRKEWGSNGIDGGLSDGKCIGAPIQGPGTDNAIDQNENTEQAIEDSREDRSPNGEGDGTANPEPGGTDSGSNDAGDGNSGGSEVTDEFAMAGAAPAASRLGEEVLGRPAQAMGEPGDTQTGNSANNPNDSEGRSQTDGAEDSNGGRGSDGSSNDGSDSATETASESSPDDPIEGSDGERGSADTPQEKQRAVAVAEKELPQTGGMAVALPGLGALLAMAGVIGFYRNFRPKQSADR